MPQTVPGCEAVSWTKETCLNRCLLSCRRCLTSFGFGLKKASCVSTFGFQYLAVQEHRELEAEAVEMPHVA